MTDTRATYTTKKALPFIQTSNALKNATLDYWIDDKLVSIALDGPEWSAWLSNEQSFRVTYNHGGRSVSFNVLSERRGKSVILRGYKNIGGKLIKKYCGTSTTLNQEKLNKAGRFFLDKMRSHLEADPTEPLYQALADYEHLVTARLLPHLPRHLAKQARAEIERIKRNLGE